MATHTKLRKSLLFYYAFIVLFTINSMLESTAIGYMENRIHDVIVLLELAMAAMCIIVKKYNYKEITILLIINLTSIMCYMFSGYTGLLMTMLAITLLPEGSLDKILRITLSIRLPLFICIAVASLLGYISNEAIIVAKNTYDTSGMTLGFGHPNTLAAELTSLVFLYLTIHRYKLKRLHIFISLLICVIIYIITKCRSALVIGFVVVFLLQFRKKQNIQEVIFEILPYVHIGTVLLVGLSMLIYVRLGHNNPLVLFINDTIFNGRIGLGIRSIILIRPMTGSRKYGF